MTNIEQKALELVNEVLAEWGVMKNAVEIPKNSDAFARALLRAIEHHEALRQEVSDAIEAYVKPDASASTYDRLIRFIIAKPDPLVEAVKDILNEDSLHEAEEFSDAIRAALDKRGFEIREKGES